MNENKRTQIIVCDKTSSKMLQNWYRFERSIILKMGGGAWFICRVKSGWRLLSWFGINLRLMWVRKFNIKKARSPTRDPAGRLPIKPVRNANRYEIDWNRCPWSVLYTWNEAFHAFSVLRDLLDIAYDRKLHKESGRNARCISVPS